MIAVIGILAIALTLIGVTGLVVLGALRAEADIPVEQAFPVGLATILLITLPASRVASMKVVGWTLVALLATIAAVWATAYVRKHRSWRLPRRHTWFLIGGPALVSLLLVIPLMILGFPTTIAWTTGDSYAYVTVAQWLVDSPLSAAIPSVTDPVGSWAANQLTFGFLMAPEHLAAVVSTFTGYPAYAVFGSTLAAGGAVATGGWMTVIRSITGRSVTRAQMLVAILAALSPTALTAFVDGYASQYLSICLFPFAVGAAIDALRRPSRRRAVIAGIGIAGMGSIYTGTLPWFALTLLGLLLFQVWESRRERAALVATCGAAGAAVLISALLAPLQWAQVAKNLEFLSLKPGYPGFPGPSDGGLWAFGVGAEWIGSLLSGVPISLSTATAATLVTLASATALVFAWSTSPRYSVVALLVSGFVTLLAVTNYSAIDPYPYGAYKAMMTGGALAGGFCLVGLVGTNRLRAAWILPACIGVFVAIWAPMTAAALDAQFHGSEGFRAPEVTMTRAINQLPDGSVVLVEGNLPGLSSFNMRMFAMSLAAAHPDMVFEGLGTTPVYLTAGNDPAWTPRRAWTAILRNEPTAVGQRRIGIADAPPYRLEMAPTLDVTTYGTSWNASESDTGRRWSWLSGPGDIVVSNRTRHARDVIVTADLTSVGPVRVVTATTASGRAAASATVPPGRYTAITIPLRVPAYGTATTRLSAQPGESVLVPPDPRPLLLQVSHVRVTPARERIR